MDYGAILNQDLSGLILAAYHLMRGMYFIDKLIPNYPEKIIDSILKSLNETDFYKLVLVRLVMIWIIL